MNSENIFFEELQNIFKNKPQFEIVKYVHVNKYIVDAVILKESEILATIEFKNIENIESTQFNDLPSFKINCKYFILSNSEKNIVYDRFSNSLNFFTSLALAIDHVIGNPSENEIEQLKDEISFSIQEIVQKFVSKDSYFDSNKITHLSNHFSKENIIQHLIYDPNGQFFHFSKDIRDMQNFENIFFKLIIEEVPEETLIYRYTSLETVFATLNYKSYRLNGIAGMNDISEVGYVETYLDKTFIPLSNSEELSAINNRFILCSSTLKDDLMQWRLYGDDCKGACLVFKTRKIENGVGMQFRKISYGIKRGNINYHPELELIKNIQDTIKEKIKQSVRFRCINIWKHFFKSHEYTPENEVRLLTILNNMANIKANNIISFEKKWCLTESHKILSPYITIPLNNNFLPISLVQIILGSKCPDIYTNTKQFECFMIENNVSHVRIRVSEINNYR